MTLRELQTALRFIAKRTRSRNRFEATLHGIKMDPEPVEVQTKKEEAPVSRLNEDQEKMVNETLMKFALSKRREVKSG